MLCSAAYILILLVAGNPLQICGFDTIERCQAVGELWKQASTGRGYTCLPMNPR